MRLAIYKAILFGTPIPEELEGLKIILTPARLRDLHRHDNNED